MMGRFNTSLQINNGKLVVAGTLDGFAGSVEIQAGVTQNGEVVKCSKTFNVTSSTNFPWSMEVSTPFVTGTKAAASALAAGSGGALPWTQADIAIT
jgi:hypothetical protein